MQRARKPDKRPSIFPACYGGVPDEEMLMALSPAHLAKAITGMKALAKTACAIRLRPTASKATCAPASASPMLDHRRGVPKPAGARY
jgi:hypothetical protein